MKYFLVISISIGVLLPNAILAKTYRITDDAFGANIHLRQRIEYGQWDTVLDQAQAAGVQWGREEFNWDEIEPSNNNFSWQQYDDVVQQYEDHDMELVGLLTYSSQWASSNPESDDYEFYPPDLEYWEEYVATVAERYKGRVDYWEIWNEPNHEGFWKGNIEGYAALLDATAVAIKDVNPNAKIVLGGLSGSDATYLDQLYSQLNHKEHIEVVAIHPYRVHDGNFNYAPEETVNGLNTLANDVYTIRAVMKEHGQGKTPIWFTEVGWTTYEDGVSEQQQAQYLTRLYTQGLSLPNVQKIFWYSFSDTAVDESSFEGHFGLVNTEFVPKQSHSAYQFVATHLPEARFTKNILPQYKIIDNFTSSLGWHFSGVECTNGKLNDTSNSMLTVHYDFTHLANCYAPVVLQKQLPKRTKSLQFKAKGSNDDTELRVRVTDKTGETFQYNMGRVPGEWVYYTVQLQQASGHWGGNNDGQLDRPLTFDSLVLDNADQSTVDGTVYIDELYSSRYAFTYLTEFEKNNTLFYAYWTAQKSRKAKLHLDLPTLTQRRWQAEDIQKSASDGNYIIRGTQAVRFFQ